MHRLLLPFACSILAVLSAEPAAAQDKSMLLVVNQGDAGLSIVDPAMRMQVAVIPEGVAGVVGHEVAVSPDGRRAYVPLYSDVGVGKPGTDGRWILVIDLATHTIVGRVDLGHGARPHCVLYDRTSDLLYVTTELDKSITIVDPHTLKIVGQIPTQQEQSHMLAISHDGKRGYTANVGPGTVSVLDLTTRKFITTISISDTTQRISVSNDDSMVFTSDQTKPRLAVIASASNRIQRWVQLPSVGYGSASTKDGTHLLITLPSAGALAVLDLKTMQVGKTIVIGERPQEVLVRPDGLIAYVSCFGGHQVAVVDLATLTVTAMIDVGQKADGMAWADAAR